MVAIGDPRNASRLSPGSKTRSKQFTAIVLSLGVIVLVWLRSVNPAREGRITSTNPETLGSALSSDYDKSVTTKIEDSPLSADEKVRGNKIKQISLLGERNSGTRWSWQ